MKKNKNFFFALTLLGILFSACVKDSDPTFGSKDINKIALSRGTLDMMEGDTVNLNVIFNSRQTQALNKELIWRVEDPAIAKVNSATGVSSPIIALSEGRTIVHVESADKLLSATKEILVGKATELNHPIYLEFGTAFFGPPFNSITDFRNHRVANLIDMQGTETGIDFEITDDFEGENRSGVLNNQLSIPPNITEDAFFGGNANPRAEIKISRLNRNAYYDLSFFGSRRDVGDNRETAYTVKGRYDAQTVYQNSSNNGSVISTVGKVRPNENGEIVITINAGPNNNNGSKYFYLNIMAITPSQN